MYDLCVLFLLFISYSFIGWLAEVTCVSFTQKRITINRGFLIGPICPIYGTAAIIMTLFLKKYLNDPVVLFAMATITCSIVEYMTSFFMEKFFHARWWDYGAEPFNLNGRICLINSLLFGVAGLILMYFINPYYNRLLTSIPTTAIYILSTLFIILLTIDCVLSIITIVKLNLSTMHFLNRDNTLEIKEKLKETLIHNRTLTKRLLNAFPKAKIPNTDLLNQIRITMIELSQKLKEEKKKRFK